MKSSYWTLCLVALFVCFTGGTSENSDTERTYLDRRKDADILDIEKFLFLADEDDEEGGNKGKETCDENDDSKKCQNSGLCEEKDSVKTCSCKPRFSGNFCQTDKCDEMDCGNDATCGLDDSGKVMCKCTNTELSFDESDKKCKATCDDSIPTKNCQNDGSCKGTDSLLFCSCKPGFSGDLCETDECKIMDCGNDATCGLDDSGKVMCKCANTELSFDKSDKKCKETCDDSNKKCQNGGSCEGTDSLKFCLCKPETSGDFCETIPKCNTMACGEDAACGLDESGKVICKCEKTELSFDSSDKKCKKTCDDSNKKCQNGGSCKGTDSLKFCSCKTETSGDLCETIPKCNGMDCGKDATCGLDESGKVMCKCNKIELSFDESDKKCKKTCDDSNKKCENGGSCEGPDSLKFCSCKSETSGDFCETIPKCKELNCGKDATCGLDESGKVMCMCTKTDLTFDESDQKCKVDYCLKNCGTHESVKCEGNKFVSKKSNCKCREEKMAFNSALKECQTDLCFDKCGVAYDSKGDVQCENGPFGIKGPVQCKCKEARKKFDPDVEKCRVPCTEKTICKHGVCEERGGNKFCDCPSGTSGDKCETVDDCQAKGKWAKCKGKKGDCSFDTTELEAICKCQTDKQEPSEEMGFCVGICESHANCTGNILCNEGLCDLCKPGYGGDDCTDFTGCTNELKKHCSEVGAECVHSAETATFATCKCKEAGYTYDGSKCIHDFCKASPCKDGECDFNKERKLGFCKCPAGKYYDYQAEICAEPDKCLLRKEQCKENEVCEDGNCRCPYDRENDTMPCEKKECDANSCFPGGECSGRNCVCKEGTIYVDNECQGGSCISEGFKTKCKCPENFQREENKECILTADSGYKNCTKNDCGYGLCYKDDESDECECFEDDYIEEKDGKCVLKVEACASKKLSKDLMKCECTGIYKQAKDGITCELITCEDDTLSKVCQSYNAPCKMKWKDIPTNWKLEHYCECPTGYVKDESRKKCIDACSTEEITRECMKKNQLCYHSKVNNDLDVTDCRCPPPIKYQNGACTGVSDYAYLMKNIPIMKAKYVNNGTVDSLLLNGDIIDSLKQTYGEHMDYGYLHKFEVDGDVLKCTVWIVFKEDPTEEKERIRLQLQKYPKESCQNESNCNTDATIWPPNILMSSSHITEVSFENLTFCSFAKDLLCGEKAKCQDNSKCVCPEGFQAPVMTMRVFGDVVIQRCEDIDECATKTDDCPENTHCENTQGSYRCVCEPGFKKEEESDDKGKCIGLCSVSPCRKGSCSVVNSTVDCKCDPGFAGSFCDRNDINLASAKKQVVVVGVVLGVILGVVLIGFAFFYRKVRKSSHSQDFTPAPRRDNAEMMERRPMRGAVNKGYE